MAVDISVILPNFNGGNYLEKAIRSIQEQTYRNWELLLIDDGSTDDSRRLVHSLAQNDKRIKLIEKENSGIVDSLNLGISKAKGEYIARMDADDIALSFRLEKQFHYLRQNDDIAILGSAVELIDEWDQGLMIDPPICSHPEIIKHLLLGHGGTIRHPTILMRRNLIEKLNGYDKKAEWAEDLDLYFRASEYGELVNFPEVLLRYRIHFKSVNYTKN